MGRIADFILGRQAVAEHHETVVVDEQVAAAWAYAYSDALGHAAILRARQMNADVLGGLPLRIVATGEAPPPPNADQEWGDLISESAMSMQDAGFAGWYVSPTNELRVTDAADCHADVTLDRLGYVWSWRTRTMRTRGVRPNFYAITMNQTKRNPQGFGWMQSARVRGVLAAQAYVEDFFKNGAKPGGILRVPSSMDEGETDELLAGWVAAEVARRPAVLSSSIEWRDTAFSPNDSQWVETHRISTGDVALLAGLRGSLLDYNTPGSSLTYETVGDVLEETYRTNWWPYYLRRFEGAIGRYLGSPVEFEVDRLVMASLASRAQATSALTLAGYEPETVVATTGLPDLEHTGEVPTTIHLPTESQ